MADSIVNLESEINFDTIRSFDKFTFHSYQRDELKDAVGIMFWFREDAEFNGCFYYSKSVYDSSEFPYDYGFQVVEDGCNTTANYEVTWTTQKQDSLLTLEIESMIDSSLSYILNYKVKLVDDTLLYLTKNTP